MKTTHSKIIGFYLTFFLLYSCQNAWEEHYLPEAVSSEKMEVFQGDAMSFIQSSKDLSLLSGNGKLRYKFRDCSGRRLYFYCLLRCGDAKQAGRQRFPAGAELCFRFGPASVQTQRVLVYIPV